MGKSGSGKSTLFNILMGKLQDYHGSVQLGGQELAALTPQQITEKILYLD